MLMLRPTVIGFESYCVHYTPPSMHAPALAAGGRTKVSLAQAPSAKHAAKKLGQPLDKESDPALTGIKFMLYMHAEYACVHACDKVF